MKNKIIFIFLVTATILFTVFILSNSLKNNSETMKDSGAVTEILSPVLENVTGDNNESIQGFVRKFAHVFEFSLLGFSVFLLCFYLKRLFNKSFLGTCLFYILFIACIDEYIQLFIGRTSSVKDILLDFTGGIFGIVIAIIFLYLIVPLYFKIYSKFAR